MDGAELLKMEVRQLLVTLALLSLPLHLIAVHPVGNGLDTMRHVDGYVNATLDGTVLRAT